MKNLKKEILEKEKKMREEKSENISISEKEKYQNDKINQTLENMANYGNIIKAEIEEEQKNNPEKFISKNDALQLEETDKELFTLGLIADILEQLGIKALIEKDGSTINDNEVITISQYLINGFITKKKYNLKFDFGEKRNEELLNYNEEYEKFKNNLKNKLSKGLNIPPEKIIVIYPQKGSFSVQVIFQNDDFNNLTLEELKQKFKTAGEKFEELKNLKEIHSDLIIGGFKLTKNQLDSAGNREKGWAEGEKEEEKNIILQKVGLKLDLKFGINMEIMNG